MLKSKDFGNAQILIIGAVLITIIATPFLNKDSLIIPKLLFLFPIALFLIPGLIFQIRLKIIHRKLLFLILLFLIQICFAIFMSTTPMEQQIFGRTGRGLGLITWISYLTIILAAAYFIKSMHLNLLLSGLFISGSTVSVYAIFQSFGLDFFPWDSKTNGVVSTLGNPNFVSSFVAFTFLPSIIYVISRKMDRKILILTLIIFIFTIYRADSLQGYVSIMLSIAVFSIIYFYYKSRVVAFLLFCLSVLCSLAFVLSSLNIGPLAQYFYKISVQSRGDFWRSAVNLSSDFPWFGTGLDSFGDYYLLYRDEVAVSHPWAEYTDSAHNYFLDYLVTGGYPFLILNVTLVLLTLISFKNLIIRTNFFDKTYVALFASYVTFLAQALISPISISIFIWSGLIGGAIIGLSGSTDLSEKNELSTNLPKHLIAYKVSSKFLALIGVLILLPLFNADRLQLSGMKAGNAEIVISSAEKFPRSVSRYSIVIRSLLSSGLNSQALNLARSAVKFNPNSPALWVLIMVNPAAPDSEQLHAKQKMLTMDPLNKEVINYDVSG
jgi:O-antigen ligase